MKRIDLPSLVLNSVGAALLCVAAVLCLAPTDGSGNYTTPGGQPVVSNTVISSATENALVSDLAAALSDRKSRSGLGDFTAPVRGANGTAALPTWSFTNDTSDGLYRSAAHDQRYSINAVDKLFISATGFGVGAAPTHLFDISAAGSAATVLASFLEPSVANGNGLTFNIGQANAGNQAGSLTYTQNVVAANSTWCMGVAGNPSALCTDGNNKTTAATLAVTGQTTLSGVLNGNGAENFVGPVTIGASGTALSSSGRGTIAFGAQTIAANACIINSVAVTPTTAGADCSAGAPSGVALSGLVAGCFTGTNLCYATICNATVVGIAIGATTVGCRIWNP